tara:strand:+ start:1710 stop:1940 length:231 start_codon:yes stop_codon:yes gene_type:complete
MSTIIEKYIESNKHLLLKEQDLNSMITQAVDQFTAGRPINDEVKKELTDTVIATLSDPDKIAALVRQELETLLTST